MSTDSKPHKYRQSSSNGKNKRFKKMLLTRVAWVKQIGARLAVKPVITRGNGGDVDDINLQQLILDYIEEGVLVLQNEKIIYGNNAIKRIIGKKDDFATDDLYAQILVEDKKYVKQYYFDIISGNKRPGIDFRILKRNGELCWLNASAKPFKSQGNERLIAFVQDITRRKINEENVKRSEFRYRQLVHKSSDIFVEIDAEGNQVFISPVAEKITGFTPEELKVPISEIIHPDDMPHVMEVWEQGIKNDSQSYRVEYRHKHKTKGYIWVEAHGRSYLNDPEIGLVHTFVRDISQRKQLEIRLKAQQEQYEIITQSISDVIWVYNLEKKRFTYISPNIVRLRGLTVAEAMEEKIEDALTPGSLNLVMKRLEEGYKLFEKEPGTLVASVNEVQQPCKDGRIIWVEISTHLRMNPMGQIEIFGVSRDINDRKKAAKALRESEEKYRKLIENMDSGVVLYNQQMEIVSHNQAAKQILGAKQELVGSKPERYQHTTIHEDESPFLPKDYPVCLALKEHRKIRNVIMGVKQQKGVRWVRINAEPLVLGDEKETFALATFSDITALKENEKQLIEANKTKDKFLSVLAHDLKGPFNAILGYAELMMESIKEHDYQNLEQMVQTSHSAAINVVTLLDNLLEWSRAKSGALQFAPSNVDVTEIIADQISFLSSMAAQKSIKLVFEETDCKYIYGDKHMLGTVVRNLISNSVKFCEAGGKVKVLCESKEGACHISVADNGVGMDVEKLGSLFRGTGESSSGTHGEEGTGLGLAVCKEFVQYHKGVISAESVPGKGTTIHINLPCKGKQTVQNH